VDSSLKRKLAIGAAALAAAAFAGGAYAATQDSGANSQQAFVNDVAKRLNISPQQLKAALKGALLDRIDAAVKAGRLTQAQASELKQRLQNGSNGVPGLPFFGGPRFFEPGESGHREGGAGKLDAAARYLGLTDAQLFDQLRSGKTLAQVSKARGKPVAGLEQAMIAASRTRLEKAVADKEITKAQEQRLLSALPARIHDLVNASGPRSGPRGFFHHQGALPGGRFYGPPPAPPAGLAVPPDGVPGPPPGPVE
jgi:hypothetical protein